MSSKSPAKPWELARSQSTPAVVAGPAASPSVPARTYGGQFAGAYGGTGGAGPYGRGYGSSAYGASPYGGYGGGYGTGASMYGRRSGYGGYGARGGMYGRSAGMYGGGGMYGGVGGMYGQSMGPPMQENGWMASIQRTLHGFGQFSELLDGSYFSMNDSFSSLMEFLHVVGELRHHVLFIIKALAGLMMLQMTGRSVKEYLGWRNNDAMLDPDLASFKRYASTKKPPSIWPKMLLVAGLLAVFGPYLWRRMFPSRPTKKVPVRRVVAVYDYVAQTPEELSLRTGDLIEIEDDRSNPDWWKGRDDEGTSGFFPSSFCEALVLDEDLEAKEQEDESDEELDEETKKMRKLCMEVVRERRRRDREAPAAAAAGARTPHPSGMRASGPASMRRMQGGGMMSGYMEEDEYDHQRRLSYSSPQVF